MRGGNLQELSNNCDLVESSIRHFTKQILNGIKHLHDNGIIHSDIKPDNCLLNERTPTAHLKLCDFSSSIFAYDNEVNITNGWTLPFCSPEGLIKKKIRKSHDIFSVGCLVYYLISNSFPFFHNRVTRKTKEAFKKGVYKKLDGSSKELDEFIEQTLATDPKNRINAHQALNHPWFMLPIHQMSTKKFKKEKKCFIYKSKLESANLDISNPSPLAAFNPMCYDDTSDEDCNFTNPNSPLSKKSTPKFVKRKLESDNLDLSGSNYYERIDLGSESEKKRKPDLNPNDQNISRTSECFDLNTGFINNDHSTNYYDRIDNGLESQTKKKIVMSQNNQKNTKNIFQINFSCILKN